MVPHILSLYYISSWVQYYYSLYMDIRFWNARLNYVQYLGINLSIGFWANIKVILVLNSAIDINQLPFWQLSWIVTRVTILPSWVGISYWNFEFLQWIHCQAKHSPRHHIYIPWWQTYAQYKAPDRFSGHLWLWSSPRGSHSFLYNTMLY